MSISDKLALFGGTPAISEEHSEMFRWPIITKEHEEAVLSVLRDGGMSGEDETMKFEQEFADWLGMKYAVGFNTGTASIHGAMFACGVGVGDEIITPSLTYWASTLPVYSLGGTVVFADVEPDTLCMDPKDIEHRITERTKAIVVVHYLSHPADMDAIMKIARKHNIKVIEDVSHAQGGSYKGRRLGTIGDVGAMSLMTGKSFAIGEAGMLVTNEREIYERAIALGQHSRTIKVIQGEDLKRYIGLPMGGTKHRMHQLSSVVGRVQLKYYDEQMERINRAMTYFWDSLEGVKGLYPHRPKKGSGSNNGGWYAARGFYVKEELGGLSVTRFCEAVRAEGVKCRPGCNRPLHTHPLLNDADIYGHGKPTRIANSDRDLRQPIGSLPVTEGVAERVFSIPWFKHDNYEIIDQYVKAFRKVAENYESLLVDDPGNQQKIGKWFVF